MWWNEANSGKLAVIFYYLLVIWTTTNLYNPLYNYWNYECALTKHVFQIQCKGRMKYIIFNVNCRLTVDTVQHLSKYYLVLKIYLHLILRKWMLLTSIYLSIYLSIYICICMCIHVSILSIYLFIHQSLIHWSISISPLLFPHSSIHPFIHHSSIHLCIHIP